MEREAMGGNAPVLFEDKAGCCGCGACLNVCPRGAIRMEKDDWGFSYPVIDGEKCVGCGLCKRVCAFSSPEKPRESLAYAAASRDGAVLDRSASGGIFAELARAVLDKGGAVYGAAWEPGLTVCHIRVERMEQLLRLQGSKYVQSDTRRSFSEAKRDLEAGRTVLFCGTPCQIGGLYGFLGKDYDTLYTVDLVCHGVPNIELLREDVKRLTGEEVTQVIFRDKTQGWGTLGCYVTADGKKHRYCSLNSPYYHYFLAGAIYRDSCYRCPYPGMSRVGDITLGDYWGIESAHPEAEKSVDLRRGVSCVLVNSPRGEELLGLTAGRLTLIPSETGKVRRRNGQLVKCCDEPAVRERLLELYRTGGYPALAEYWKKRERKRRLVLRLKSLVPYRLKRLLKRKGV